MGGGILMAPNVQKDLKLSDEQIGKVQATLTEIRQKHADEQAAIRDLPQEERPAKAAALSKTIAAEVKTALAFSPEQAKRYDQISLQARGLQAFSDPTVLEAVKLTDDQRSKIREIAQASQGQGGGANLKDASEEERAAILKKMADTRKENMAKVLATFSDDQKKAWKELTGEPIQFQFQGRRPNN
jgi:hypothetical protein